VAKLKAEFLQQYYDANGIPFRSRLIANFSKSAKLGSMMPSAYNFFVKNNFTGKLIKKISGFAVQRSMPQLYKTTLRKWNERRPNLEGGQQSTTNGQLYLFCDEFTNYNDVEIGIKTILLLEKLGYEIIIPHHLESGRTWLSKGLVREAKKIINNNIELLSPLINHKTPLIGIEPSAILTFRDEYIDLADDNKFDAAKKLAQHVFTIEEFIAVEIEKGNIKKEQFTTEKKEIKLHGHCQQKALSSVDPTVKMLSLPQNYSVSVIPSGCCGMAGSFGYEKEHYDISMKIGELVLFPTVRNQSNKTIIAAPGTSCRHQVKDGTGRIAKHPVEILYEALK
jgi:Fe-S oxidoreductase